MSRVTFADSWPNAVCTCLIEQPAAISADGEEVAEIVEGDRRR